MKRINDLIQLSVPVLRRPCSDAPEADYQIIEAIGAHSIPKMAQLRDQELANLV